MFRYPRHLLVKLLVIAGLGFLVLGQPAASPGPSPPRLQGTFIQLTEAHGDWQAGDWAALFESFQKLQLSQLVIQWTVDGDLAYFPASGYRQVPNPPLATLMQLADAAGMQVLVGLVHDPAFWEKIDRDRDPDLVEVYLRRLNLQSQAVATQLAPLVQEHRSFQGWYIPQEVDDVNWQEAAARRHLFTYLRDLGAFLHRTTPAAKVALSGFANGCLDPKSLQLFWQALLDAAPVDVVLFQDGIGVKKLELDYLPLYLEALRQATQSRGRTLEVVVELFRQVSEKPSRATPASWERIARQLAMAARFAPGGALAFSIPEYMSPRGGPEAGRLFETYRRSLQPSAPSR